MVLHPDKTSMRLDDADLVAAELDPALTALDRLSLWVAGVALAALAALAIMAIGTLASVHAPPAPTAPPPALAHGIVTEVDPATARITIRHGDIPDLGMPAMTMVFRAAHADLLAGIEVGQSVGFRARRIDGGFVLTGVQRL